MRCKGPRSNRTCTIVMYNTTRTTRGVREGLKQTHNELVQLVRLWTFRYNSGFRKSQSRSFLLIVNLITLLLLWSEFLYTYAHTSSSFNLHYFIFLCFTLFSFGLLRFFFVLLHFSLFYFMLPRLLLIIINDLRWKFHQLICFLRTKKKREKRL